jgi:enoyl-CoA hydratase
MEFDNILLYKAGSIATVTLNRPEALNALNTATLKELGRAFDAVSADSRVRVLVITGAGDQAFCAGADIKELDKATVKQADAFMRLGRDVFHKLEAMDLPVIAAVNGYALGGGCELALACDLRMASTKAKFGQPEVGLGNIPGWGGTQRLPRLVGVGKAKEILFTGEMIDAQEAWRIGLVNRVFSPEKLMEATYELAEIIANKAPLALHFAKRAVDLAMDSALATGMMYESLGEAFCARTDDQKEGLKAVREKRSPFFRGE